MLMVLNVKAQPCKLTMGLEISYWSLEQVVFPFKGSQNFSVVTRRANNQNLHLCKPPWDHCSISNHIYIMWPQDVYI